MDAALITGATAVSTGLLGYLGAMLQHRSERDRIGVERARLRLDQTRTEEEAAARKAQQLDEQRDRRRLLYLNYLEVAEDSWTLSVRLDPVQESEVDSWWRTYQGVRRQLQIGATTEVSDAAEELNQTLIEMFPNLVDAARQDDAEAAHAAREAVWRTGGQRFDQTLLDLQRIMRADLDVEG